MPESPHLKSGVILVEITKLVAFQDSTTGSQKTNCGFPGQSQMLLVFLDSVTGHG